MYISSGFLNKNAHKFFNGNVEKNDFFGINRVRFMQTQSFGGVTPFVYTPTGRQGGQDNKGITDTITTVIRSPADLQALTKGGNAYLPPDVYAALARGEEVAVTLNKRPPERVNLLVPVFAAFAQMAGSSGAAYNKELGEAIQGKGAGSGTGLGAAADFVNRYGGDYSLNPFGGASHTDIDTQYEILGKKNTPEKVQIVPYVPIGWGKTPSVKTPIIDAPIPEVLKKTPVRATVEPLHITKSDTTDGTMQRPNYNELVGGREYLLPFVSDLEKNGVNISSLKNKSGEIDQKKALVLLKSLASGEADPSVKNIIKQLNLPENQDLKKEIKTKAKEVVAIIDKHELGNTREQEGLQVLTQYEKYDLVLGKNAKGAPLLTDDQVNKLLAKCDLKPNELGMTREKFKALTPERQAEIIKKIPDSQLTGILHNQVVFQRVDARDANAFHKKDLKGSTEIKDNAPFVSSIPVTSANLKSSYGANRAVTDFLSLGAKAHLTISINGQTVPLTQKMIDSAKNDPNKLVKLFNATERTLENKFSMKLDGKLGAEHITEIQRAMIERGQILDLGSEAAFNVGTGNVANEQALGSLLTEYNSSHSDQPIKAEDLKDPKKVATLLEYAKTELTGLSTAAQSTGYIKHGQMDQMGSDISALITGGGKPNAGLDAMIQYIKTPPPLQTAGNPQNEQISNLRTQASSLSHGIESLSQIYNQTTGSTPLSEGQKSQLETLATSAGVKPEEIQTMLSDPFSETSRKTASKLVNNFSEQITSIIKDSKGLLNETSLKTEDKPAIEGLVSEVENLKVSTNKLSEFISKGDTVQESGVTDSLNSISDFIKNNSDPKKAVDSENLLKVESAFKNIIQNVDPYILEKPALKNLVALINEKLPALAQRSKDSPLSGEIVSTMDDIKKAMDILNTPKPAIVTKPAVKPKVETSQPEVTPVLTVNPTVTSPKLDSSQAKLHEAAKK